MGGAAGYEVDAADHRSGTAPHALVVEADQSGAPRADVVFYETVSGGAVFATGFITWTGSLSHQDGATRSPASPTTYCVASSTRHRFTTAAT